MSDGWELKLKLSTRPDFVADGSMRVGYDAQALWQLCLTDFADFKVVTVAHGRYHSPILHSSTPHRHRQSYRARLEHRALAPSKRQGAPGEGETRTSGPQKGATAPKVPPDAADSP